MDRRDNHIAGYYTRLRHIDFCRRSASAIIIPLGLALVLRSTPFCIFNSVNLQQSSPFN
jgi:hypothetical protein